MMMEMSTLVLRIDWVWYYNLRYNHGTIYIWIKQIYSIIWKFALINSYDEANGQRML